MATEKRLIDVDVCLHDMCRRCNIENEGCPCEPPDCFIYNVLDNAPTVDAVEVVHGRWDGNGNCSACGKNIYEDIDADMWSCYEPPYCPDCGAKMDGDGNG